MSNDVTPLKCAICGKDCWSTRGEGTNEDGSHRFVPYCNEHMPTGSISAIPAWQRNQDTPVAQAAKQGFESLRSG